MRPLLTKALLALGLLAVFALGALAWALQQHPSLQPYADLRWKVPAGGEAPPPVKVTFLGVSTVLLDDGETALMTDGFFSRPGKLQTFLGKVEPDMQAITQGLRRAGLPGETGRLAAVIPVHSHYDHAMDAPEVARRMGALLLGSESTANVGRGWGLAEAQIRVAKLGEPQRFGRFTATLFASRHAPTGFTGGEVTAPLHPPVRASDYKEGQSYALHVEHGGRTLLIVGSAGFEPGALRGVQADVVLQGIGALGPRPESYRDALWTEVIAAVGARRVIPIHWDDFWQPPGRPMQPMPPPLDAFDVSMAYLRERGARDGVDVRLPLEWQAMDVWAGLPARR
ncbi:MBL fold metallo-hydrolase [Acidovorax sp. sif1233]|uniref:MBL fold metallo-hydrolase n=1 Tax=Acidovorax sp. sif1233 TaxID=2854792 RepID=UPI0021049EB0|nr:MBL fold metallo-hydrolase [Acidovorax sp. sif1233]